MASGFLLCKLTRSLTVRPSTPLLCNPMMKRYTHAENQGHRGVEEKAPSLADEFRRVAEEKAKAEEKTEQVADQGIASQTSDKTSDGAEEAATVGRGGGDTEAVKGRYKGHEPGADYRRRR